MSTRRNIALVASALAGLSVLALAIAWTQRRPIARDVIDRYLNARGVKARYDLVQLGTKHQRLENIVIGDPANPEMTVKWAEVDGVASLSGFDVKAIRAVGVRAKARLVDGRLSLGALDRLLPQSSGAASQLPDMDVGLGDTRVKIDTPYGQIGAHFEGGGNLAGAFKGQVAIVAAGLRAGSGPALCQSARSSAYGAIALQDGAASFSGPVRLASAQCRGVAVQALDMTVDGNVDAAFERWEGAVKLGAGRVVSNGIAADGLRGNADLGYTASKGQWRGYFDGRSTAASLPNGVRAQGLSTRFDFVGTTASTVGKYNLTVASATHPRAKLTSLLASGNYDVGLGGIDGLRVTTSSVINARQIVPDAAWLGTVQRLANQSRGTPMAPLGSALLKDLTPLTRGGSAKARMAFDLVGGRTGLQLSDITAQSKNGVTLTTDGAAPFTMTSPGGIALAGTARIMGGGLPTTVLAFSGNGRAVSGLATIAPYQSGDARLALTPAKFAYGPGGLSFETRATVDGSFAGGRVAGLVVPVAVRGGAVAMTGCMPVRYTRLMLPGLSLSPTAFNACLTPEGASIAQPRFNGNLGGTPIKMAASRATFGFSGFTFSANDLDVSLGSRGALSRFTASALSGAMRGKDAAGRFTGGNAEISTVPLSVSGANGSWRYVGGGLTIGGGLTVADKAPTPRFFPVVSDDFALKFIGGIITATGTARAPVSGPAFGTAIGQIALRHQLSSGTGGVDLIVPGLRFGPQLQPEALTNITNGVIAIVDGVVAGKGRINWSPSGVTSNGRFYTEGMNFAAAFGSVTDLKGEIALSDLLGFETGPGQSVTLGTINPGILVSDGIVKYRLLPGMRIAVEGGRWPLAGGILTLDPTILDLSEKAERRLTFRVTGLDVAQFITQMEFENITATGTLDGVLPMIFDQSGGRIEGGLLVAREGGGTLSYVGEVSQENLGTYGSIAFDALKAMKFQRLTIDLGGPLDGEMVSRINFDGINQNEIIPGRRKLPIPVKVVGLTGIPFIFKIKITAPFRGLIGSMRSFQDPTVDIEKALDEERRREREAQIKAKAEPPVQPAESEVKP
jgi:translocation and assembly module TamB